MTTELKNRIESQLRFNLPEGYFNICVKESKTSSYFYVGTEKQLEDFENGIEFKDGELLKFRVSDHDSICGASWAHESVILNYFGNTGYYLDHVDFSSKDENEIAKLIVKQFMNYFN